MAAPAHWGLLGLLCGTWLWGSAAQRSTPAPTGQSPGAPQLQFRLAGYPRKHNEGRIEVSYNQEWGTICDDDFTLANAHVLCRHLGFVAATGWAHSAKYGKGIGKPCWIGRVGVAGIAAGIISMGGPSSTCASPGAGDLASPPPHTHTHTRVRAFSCGTWSLPTEPSKARLSTGFLARNQPPGASPGHGSCVDAGPDPALAVTRQGPSGWTT